MRFILFNLVVGAAVVSAVEDALRPFGVQIDEAPILPERICELIDAARQDTQEAS